VEMTPFQEAFFTHWLVEYVAPGDLVPDVVLVPIYYAAVIGGECLEVTAELDNKVVHHDLMMGSFLGLPLANSDSFPIALSSCT